MSIEKNPPSKFDPERVAAFEKKLRSYAADHEEFESLTPKEFHDAAELGLDAIETKIDKHFGNPQEKLYHDLLRARLEVRNIADATPITDSSGTMIGMARTSQEAAKLYHQDDPREHRI